MPCPHMQVFLTVDARKRVTGCLVIEGPVTAHPVVLDTTGGCSPASRQAVGGENVPPSADLGPPNLAITAKRAPSTPCFRRIVAGQGNSAPAVLLAIDDSRHREAVCGVKGVWVSQSARRSRVATDLLDAAR